MNILFLTRRFWPNLGGVEKHIVAVSRELIKLGHQVTVITLKHKPELKTQEIYQKIKIVRFPDSNSKFIIWKNLWQQRALIKAVDVVHCHDIFFWYLPFRFLYSAKPVFITFHGWEGEWPIPQKNIILRKIWEKLAWGNICIGDYLKIWYKTKPNVVSYGGIYKSICDRKSNYINKRKVECIFIGRLSEDNGLKEYLKVFRILRKKSGFKITFVGDGPLKKQCAKLGKVTGMIKDPGRYLSGAAVVFTSSYLSVLEAMVLGKPIFVLAHNQLKYDCFKFHPALKYLNLSRNSEELLIQLAKKQNKTKAAYQWVKDQTWTKLCRQYLSLWQSKANLPE